MSSEMINVVGEYYRDDKGNLKVKQKDGGFRQIARFTPIFDRREMYGNSEIIWFKYILNGNTYYMDRPIPKEQITVNYQIMKTFPSGLIIEKGRGNLAAVCEMMNLQLTDASYVYVYDHLGFVTINNKAVYLNNEFSLDSNGLNSDIVVKLDYSPGENGSDDKGFHYKFIKSDLPIEDAFKYFTKVKQIVDNRVLMPSWAYICLAPLNYVLNNTDIGSSRFVMYYGGKTGVYKTSFCRFLLNAFGDFSYQAEGTITPTSTVNATESELYNYWNTVILLDDLRPEDNPEHANILRMLSNTIGDGNYRNRLNSDGSKKKARIPSGLCVLVTAEDRQRHAYESLLARYLTFSFTDETISNKDEFRSLYEERIYLNVIMQHFIKYIISHQQEIQTWVINLEKTLGKGNLDDIKHERIKTSCKQLLYSYYVWLKFCMELSLIDKESANSELWLFQNYVHYWGKINNKLAFSEKWEITYLRLLLESFETNSLCFVEVKDNVAKDRGLKNIVGYYETKQDGEYLYLTALAYEEIKKLYYQYNKKNFGLSKEKVNEYLKTLGVYENGKDNRYQKVINGSSRKFQRVNVAKAKSIIEKIDREEVNSL